MAICADTTGSNPWTLDLSDLEVPALAQVRRWAARTLTAIDDAHLADVTLAATEMVTNAYQHGNGPRHIRTSHTLAPCEVLVEVDDTPFSPAR